MSPWRFKQHIASTFKHLTKQTTILRYYSICFGTNNHACIMKYRFLVILSPFLLVAVSIWTLWLQDLWRLQTLTIYGQIKYHVISHPWHDTQNILDSFANLVLPCMTCWWQVACTLASTNKMVDNFLLYSYWDVVVCSLLFLMTLCKQSETIPPCSTNERL